MRTNVLSPRKFLYVINFLRLLLSTLEVEIGILVYFILFSFQLYNSFRLHIPVLQLKLSTCTKRQY